MIKGYYVSFGLLKGSGDLIGVHSLRITPEMVGKKVGVFLSVETKRPKGTAKKHQTDWKDAINNAGGIAIVCKDPDLIHKMINKQLEDNIENI